jgi:RAB protein geranylgeranyltransferase component A
VELSSLHCVSHLELKMDEEYDVIVLGTGMTEAVLAAAFARRGKSVLHVRADVC